MIPAEILQMDADDRMAHKRGEFVLPQDTVYMDGNSLGPLPVRAAERINEVVHGQWGNDLISSWNKHQWIDLPTIVGEKIALLIGAAAGQVICCDSISVNLFKVLASALALNPDRNVVLSEKSNFPTDLYMVQGMADLLGDQRCRLLQVDSDQLIGKLDQSVAVLMLTQVNFRSGELHDIHRLTELAHQQGILVVWDLAHSAGALAVDLDRANADFAVGCGYKYLNGGPGAPAFIYVAKRHQNKAAQPLSGWMGHRRPFAFDAEYRAADGVGQYLAGTPGIISMAALDAALDVFADVDISKVRAKSIGLSELFRRDVKAWSNQAGLNLVSPQNPELRGSQLAFSHPQAFAICQALIDHKVIVDFRSPDIVRFGFTPLYLRFEDVWQAAQIFKRIVIEKIYSQPCYQVRGKVT